MNMIGGHFACLSEIRISHFFGIPVVAVGIYDDTGVVAIMRTSEVEGMSGFRHVFDVSFFEVDIDGFCEGSQTRPQRFDTEAQALTYIRRAMSSEDMGLDAWEFRL